jgi:hypothetical protein
VSYVDTTVTALGVTRRAVLTHSQTLHDKQSRGFTQTLGTAIRRLVELQQRLAGGATRRSRDAVQVEITTILKPAGSARSSPPPSPVTIRPSCA